MTEPLVSIIVPSYNAEKFLDQSIPSAQKQTHSNVEIVIIDDASTDNTFQIAQRYAREDARVVVLRHEKNAGLAATRNTGIAGSRGEWVAFLDADDLFFPRKIELQLALWRGDQRANLLYTNYQVWDGQNDIGLRYKKTSRMPEGDVSQRLWYENQFCPSTVMLRRETLQKVGGFNPALLAVEDWDLWLRIAEGGLWARGVWEPQLRYRVWAGNMSKNSDKMTRYLIATLESALARPQPPERQAHYRRSLKHAKASREFSLARKFVGDDSQALAAAALRAWRLRPSKIKWLFWALALSWPQMLGGRLIQAPVNRRISQKW